MISFDIETIPNIDLIDTLPDPTAPANYKDPDKIKAYIDEKRKEQIEQMALSPWTGRICSFATWGLDGQRNVETLAAITNDEEIKLIESALQLFVFGQMIPQVCTWNGWKFDLPFLFKRAMMLKVKLPQGLPPLKSFSKKYDDRTHIDLAQEIEQWSGGYMSLANAAQWLLGEKKIDVDVKTFRDMIVAGKQDDIATYNLRDAELTFKIYEAMLGYIF